MAPKARVKWLQHGDRDSKYFHAGVKLRISQAAINRIKDSHRNWVIDDNGIGREAIRIFFELFSAYPISTF